MEEQVNPTRMELIKTKERILLAEKGHELLKQKRDVLVIELMDLLHTSRLLRSELNEQMRKSYISIATAQSYHSVFELENIALSTSRMPKIKISVRNTMGVKLPVIKKESVKRKLSERGYSIVGSSAKIDEVAEKFERALGIVLELAEKEVSMKKLLSEIEKTNRRVNALEYILIPGLHSTKKEISFKLDEVERGNFVTLKVVKEYLEKSEV